MNLCVIPARGGSKRLPRKNIKEFLGKPIIAYSIEAALKSNCFDQIIVSTEDDEIADISKKYGAEVPFVRPDELSDDFATTFSVIQHAIDQIDSNVQNVCCLYATAPFIDSKTLYKSFTQFIKSEANYCLGITRFSSPIQRAIRVSKQNRLKMFDQGNSQKRSQDLDEAYHDAGQFCWGKASSFKEELSLYSGSTLPFVLPRHLVQDIDTMEDWVRAEAMFEILKKN